MGIGKAQREEMEATFEELKGAGARGRAVRIVREGLPALPANAEINKRKKEAAQYRAGVALIWDRERILQETGWSLQQFMAVERYVQDEDLRLTKEADPRQVFAQYRLQQLQAAQELEDLAEIFRSSRQFTALVSAVKTRSEILDKVIKTGQELGILKRAAREVNVNAKVDFRAMSVNELRVHLQSEMSEVRDLLQAEPAPSKLANSVLNRILTPKKEDAVEAEGVETEPEKTPRVKRLAKKS